MNPILIMILSGAGLYAVGFVIGFAVEMARRP
jgi:hypothetical protein